MKITASISALLLACAALSAQAQTPAVKPLDLRVGKVQRYMMPADYQAALSAPDADKSAIVVEGSRIAPELVSLRTLPRGIPALFWSFAHPTKMWRVFVPDLTAAPAGPTINKIPPPVFRWGP